MRIKKFTADPDSDLDYSVDWSDWLEDSETIVTSTWSITEGTAANVTLHDDGITSGVAYTFVSFSDVDEGDEFTLTNEITTNNTPERVENRSMKISIVEK